MSVFLKFLTSRKVRPIVPSPSAKQYNLFGKQCEGVINIKNNFLSGKFIPPGHDIGYLTNNAKKAFFRR